MNGANRLFGPDSITWRVHLEPSMILGGLRALYLQALHPRAMWGVAQNSEYRSDTWGRLGRTVDYVTTTTFGTEQEAERSARRVRKIHAMLRGRDADTGEVFHIDDPELLLWVHCAEIDSYLSVTRRAGLRLTAAQADRYVDEQRQRAARIGLDPATAPASTAELAAYFTAIRPALRCTKEARYAAFFLLTPPMPRWLVPARIGFASLSGICFAALPAWARRMYGVPTPPGSDMAATAALLTLRQTLGRLPPRRETPMVTQARDLMAARSRDRSRGERPLPSGR